MDAGISYHRRIQGLSEGGGQRGAISPGKFFLNLNLILLLEIFLLIFSSNILHLNPDTHRTCKKKPVACQENATFVLLPNFDDYKYDDLGSHRNHGYKGYVITLNEDNDDDDDDVIMHIRQHQGNIPSLRSNKVFLKKTYWVHSKVKEFKRRTTEIFLAGGIRGDLVFLECAFDGEPC
jgi:hypothetical protein